MVATDTERDQRGHCAVSTSLHTRPCLFIRRDTERGRGGLGMESHILRGRQVTGRTEKWAQWPIASKPFLPPGHSSVPPHASL